jgi:4-hydroxy-2-oxoheptanedioate aldolase
MSATHRFEDMIGYWVVMDAPVATERIARQGYDYVCVDAQHGLLDHGGVIRALTAVHAGGAIALAEGRPAPRAMVRVRENAPGVITQALDAGADGVIVPMINDAQDAASAVASVRYPPLGERSYGPMRSSIRVGTDLAEINARLRCYIMIETRSAVENVEAIAATAGVDGLYIGPSDLRIALGGATSIDPAVDDVFDEALARIQRAARAAGIRACIHTASGEEARRRREQGFDMVTVASDLVHLDAAARTHLDAARAR